jgi:hypothetical protein
METNWRLGVSDGGLSIVECNSSIDGTRQIVAKPYSIDGMSATDVARLIAAAPDMLQALRQALPIVDSHRRMAGGDGDATALLMRHVISTAEPGGAA